MKTEIQPILEAQASKECRPMKKVTNGLVPLNWKNILAPIDLSEPSKSALKTAVALAQKCGAKLTLLSIAQLPDCCSFDAPPDADEIMYLARRSLDEIARTFPPEIICEKVVRFGTPIDQIVREAKNEPADLIVISTHGYSGLKRVLLGGTAERVVRHAPCPVLVVRPIADCSQKTSSPASEPVNAFRTN